MRTGGRVSVGSRGLNILFLPEIPTEDVFCIVLLN